MIRTHDGFGCPNWRGRRCVIGRRFNESLQRLAATLESLGMLTDMVLRRSAEMPQDTAASMDATLEKSTAGLSGKPSRAALYLFDGVP